MLNEGYKTVGEIHDIMGKIDSPLRKQLLVDYYSSLTEVRIVKYKPCLFQYIYMLPFYEYFITIHSMVKKSVAINDDKLLPLPTDFTI